MQQAACSRRAFLALSGAGILALAGAGGCSNGKNLGTLKVGVRSDIVGMSEYNENTKKYYGMEEDIATELASRLGYSGVKYTAVTPETRKQTLLDGKVDALIACYSISDSREANFDFSPAYYEDSVVLMVQNSSLMTKLDDLKGCWIGTMSGANTAPILLEKLKELGFTEGNVQEEGFSDASQNVLNLGDNLNIQYDNWRLLEFDSYQDLFDALEIGDIDAMAADQVIAKTYMNGYCSVIPDFECSPQQYAVATQKDSSLSKQVSEAMQAMIDDGTIEQLKEKWM